MMPPYFDSLNKGVAGKKRRMYDDEQNIMSHMHAEPSLEAALASVYEAHNHDYPMNDSKMDLSPNLQMGGHIRGKRSCTRWTEEENRKLADAVMRHQGKNWVEIAKYVGNKTSDQCNQHWHRVLNPQISKHPWTHAEDTLLLARVKEFGESSWKKVAQALPGRTDLQCRHRWTQLKKNVGEISSVQVNSPASSAAQDSSSSGGYQRYSDAPSTHYSSLNQTVNLHPYQQYHSNHNVLSQQAYPSRRSPSSPTRQGSNSSSNTASSRLHLAKFGGGSTLSVGSAYEMGMMSTPHMTQAIQQQHMNASMGHHQQNSGPLMDVLSSMGSADVMGGARHHPSLQGHVPYQSRSLDHSDMDSKSGLLAHGGSLDNMLRQGGQAHPQNSVLRVAQPHSDAYFGSGSGSPAAVPGNNGAHLYAFHGMAMGNSPMWNNAAMYDHLSNNHSHSPPGLLRAGSGLGGGGIASLFSFPGGAAPSASTSSGSSNQMSSSDSSGGPTASNHDSKSISLFDDEHEGALLNASMRNSSASPTPSIMTLWNKDMVNFHKAASYSPTPQLGAESPSPHPQTTMLPPLSVSQFSPHCSPAGPKMQPAPVM